MPDIFDEVYEVKPDVFDEIESERESLRSQTREARAEAIGNKAISGLANIGERIAYTAALMGAKADPTGVVHNMLVREGYEVPTVIPPQAIEQDIRTVGQFGREALGNLGIRPGPIAPEIERPLTEFAAENIAGLAEAAPQLVLGKFQPRPVARYFQGQMAAGLPGAIEQAVQAETPEEKLKTGLQLGANVAFPAAIELGLRQQPIRIPDIPGSVLRMPAGAEPRIEPPPPIDIGPKPSPPRPLPEIKAIASETGTPEETVAKGVRVEANDHPEVAKSNPELLPTLVKDELKLDKAAYDKDKDPGTETLKPEPIPSATAAPEAEPAKAVAEPPPEPVPAAAPAEVTKESAIARDITDIATAKPWNLGYSVVMPEAEAQFYFPSESKAKEVLGRVTKGEVIETLGDLFSDVADRVGKVLETGQKGFKAYYNKPSEIEAGKSVKLELKNPMLVREPYGYGFDESDLMALVRTAIQQGHDGLVILNESALPKDVLNKVDKIFEHPQYGTLEQLDDRIESLKWNNLKRVDWENGEHTIVTFDRTLESEPKSVAEELSSISPDHALDLYNSGKITKQQLDSILSETKPSTTAHKPAVSEAKPSAKQPWEMTKDEYHDEHLDDVLERRKLATAPEGKKPRHPDDVHRESVTQALSEGKPVPAEVLADYPDLAPKPPPPQPSAGIEKQGKEGKVIPKRVEVAGAEFDVVSQNPDGTLKLKSEGGEFDTLPGETWRAISPDKSASLSPKLDTTKVSKAEFQKSEIDRIKAARQITLLEIQSEIRRKYKPSKPLPVGIDKLQAFKLKSRFTPEERKLLARLTNAERDSQADLRLDFENAGRVWDAINRKQQPPKPGPGAQTVGETQPPQIGPGPGAMTATEPPKAQIEQLTDAFKGIEAEKVPLKDQVKEAFSVGEKFSGTKDLFSRALSGLKSSGDWIIQKWKAVPDIDNLLRAKGDLSAQLQANSWRTQKWIKQALKAIPRKRDQAAIAKWIDAGGDRAELERGFRETKPEFKQAYLDALNLKGDLLVAARNAQNYFESRLQEAVDAGVLKDGVEDYIHRIYESRPDVAEKAVAHVQDGILKANPDLAKKRVFQFDWEAEKLGYKPVQSFITRLAVYESSLAKALAAREFIRKATTMKAADGRPIVDVKGVGIPLEDAGTGERTGTLIKPQFNPAKANVEGTANYRGDYVNKEFPALSKWKWVSEDAAGKPILVQGDVAIHPDYVHRINALLEPSRVRYGRYGKVLKPAMAVSSTVKQTMLDLSMFHQVQITVHGLEHKVLPGRIGIPGTKLWMEVPRIPGFAKVIQDIDLENTNVQGLLKGGISLGGEYSPYHAEGLVGSSLTRHIPFLGPLTQAYHDWLFQSYIPRIKMTMALSALERNRARYKGELTDEQILHKTARQANSAFGELNYVMLERSKTAQDIARLIMLAPDFLEARGRFAAEALTKGGKSTVPGFGNEQRAALLLGALTLYMTARMANKMINDQYHFEPENAFSVVKDGHAYSLRTVQGDILHLLAKPLQFWMNRLNPVYGRTLLQIATGRDYFGRKRSVPETLWDSVANTMPIALRSSRERALWESIANSMGVQAKRWSDVDDAFTLAKKWKDAHGIGEKGEFIYDPDKDPLRPLKIALSHGDDAGASKEIGKLTEGGTKIKKLNDYFDRYASMPFTGSAANDRKWQKELTEDEKKTVLAAREHKKSIKQLYLKARGQYFAAKNTPQ